VSLTRVAFPWVIGPEWEKNVNMQRGSQWQFSRTDGDSVGERQGPCQKINAPMTGWH
jgi:hypothetical protein